MLDFRAEFITALEFVANCQFLVIDLPYLSENCMPTVIKYQPANPSVMNVTDSIVGPLCNPPFRTIPPECLVSSRIQGPPRTQGSVITPFSHSDHKGLFEITLFTYIPQLWMTSFNSNVILQT